METNDRLFRIELLSGPILHVYALDMWLALSSTDREIAITDRIIKIEEVSKSE